MVVFHKDKVDTFTCKVNVQGSTIDKCVPRIVLSFNNGITMMFEGIINNFSIAEIKIPEIPAPDLMRGCVRLEIIVEKALLTPWQDEFVLKNALSVGIENIKIAGSRC